ncbi:MAG: D-alanyl-D-alanine carboxypeptidase family protein, partial [Hyphomicrobiaceae bacterium]
MDAVTNLLTQRGMPMILRLIQSYLVLHLAVLGFLVVDTATAWAQRDGGRREASSPPSIKAKHAVLMDALTGAIIFQRDGDEPAPPYGLSKLMALEIIFHDLKAGKIKLTDDIKMSENAWRTGGAPSPGTPKYVKVNTTETLETLLQGIVVQSANDATSAVAEAISGSETAFAKRMTREARRIGLASATFTNATGMPEGPQQGISARELADLARYIMQTYPEQYARFGQKELRYGKFRFINDNPLLGELGVDGIKTGFVRKHSYGLVASGNKNGRRLILVLMGLDSVAEVKTDATRLLDWGFDALHEVKIFDKGAIVTKARVWGGDRMWVGLRGDGPISIVLPRYPAHPKLTAVLVYKRPLKLPIHEGDRVAVLRVTTPTKTVTEVPLYAAETVHPGGLVSRGLDTLFDMT